MLNEVKHPGLKFNFHFLFRPRFFRAKALQNDRNTKKNGVYPFLSAFICGKNPHMTDNQPMIQVRGKRHEMRAGIPVRKAMKILQITPDSHLIIRRGELITDDEILQPGDLIELLPVISGG
jgi:sulfur carrier protein ThiS